MPPAKTPAAGASDQERARALAGARRAQLRRRTQRIRKGVATMAVTLFLLAFMGVYVQMATGHDPALTAKRRSSTAGTSLSAGAKSASKTKAATDSSTSSSNDEATSSSSDEEASSAATEESTTSKESTKSFSSSETSEPSSVTTSQS